MEQTNEEFITTVSLNTITDSYSLISVSGKIETGKFDFAADLLLKKIDDGKKACFICLEFNTNIIYDVLKIKYRDKQIDLESNIYLYDKVQDIQDIINKIKELNKLGVNFFLIDSIERIINNISLNKNEVLENTLEQLNILKNELEITIVITTNVSKENKVNETILNASDVNFYLKNIKFGENKVSILKNKRTNFFKKFIYKIFKDKK